MFFAVGNIVGAFLSLVLFSISVVSFRWCSIATWISSRR